MPLKVRLKIVLALSLTVVVTIAFWQIHWILSLLWMTAVLLVIEMLNPQWNFFGTAITKVTQRKSSASNGESRSQGLIALTFDDGPGEVSPQILDILKAHGVIATFFLLGKSVHKYPEIAQRIYRDGHLIGLHGFAHKKYMWKSQKFISDDLDQCEKILKELGITHHGLVRFPHGTKNIFAVREAARRNLRICSWNRGVWDSKNPGVEEILRRLHQSKSGEIILLHDSDGNGSSPRVQTKEALKLFLEQTKLKVVPLIEPADLEKAV